MLLVTSANAPLNRIEDNSRRRTMYIDWSRIAPVLVSIAIIIVIAIVRQCSQTLAAITVTMPLNIPLGMWIVYSGSDNHQAAMSEFSEAAMMNIIPTVVFLIVA